MMSCVRSRIECGGSRKRRSRSRIRRNERPTGAIEDADDGDEGRGDAGY
jgi:hypothetical protein